VLYEIFYAEIPVIFRKENYATMYFGGIVFFMLKNSI
jgi:uncharacterized membrane protein YeiH